MIFNIHSLDREEAANVCAWHAQALIAGFPFAEVPDAGWIARTLAHAAHTLVVRVDRDAYAYGSGTIIPIEDQARLWLEAEALLRDGWKPDEEIEVVRRFVGKLYPSEAVSLTYEDTMRHDETRLIGEVIGAEIDFASTSGEPVVS